MIDIKQIDDMAHVLANASPNGIIELKAARLLRDIANQLRENRFAEAALAATGRGRLSDAEVAAEKASIIGMDQGSPDGDCTVRGHQKADGTLVIDSVEYAPPSTNQPEIARKLVADGASELDRLRAFRAFFRDRCEPLFSQFGLEAIDLYNAAGAPAQSTPDIHPSTLDLVRRFSAALLAKLAAAEKKYGYSDGWMQPDWMDECRAKLLEHVAKGDPRDVAAYCAFLWHHGARTAIAPAQAKACAWQCKRDPKDYPDEWRECSKDVFQMVSRTPDSPWIARELFDHPAERAGVPDGYAIDVVRDGLIRLSETDGTKQAPGQCALVDRDRYPVEYGFLTAMLAAPSAESGEVDRG